MLKVHLDERKNIAMISVKGIGIDTLSELTFLINHIYNLLDDDNAISFKYLVQEVIADDASPVWEREEKTGNKTDGITNILFKFPWSPE